MSIIGTDCVTVSQHDDADEFFVFRARSFRGVGCDQLKNNLNIDGTYSKRGMLPYSQYRYAHIIILLLLLLFIIYQHSHASHYDVLISY